jgi:hypothetical protein
VAERGLQSAGNEQVEQHPAGAPLP